MGSFLLIICLTHTGANNKSCSIVCASGVSDSSLAILFSTSSVMFSSPMLRSACTSCGMSSPLYAKFFGAACVKVIVLFLHRIEEMKTQRTPLHILRALWFF